MTLKVKMIKTTDSSNIDAIGYLKESKLLFIRFNSGRVYVYHGVPVTRFTDLRDASSKGEFFNQHVKPNFSAATINATDDVVFIDEDGENAVPPRIAMEAVVDARWNW